MEGFLPIRCDKIRVSQIFCVVICCSHSSLFWLAVSRRGRDASIHLSHDNSEAIKIFQSFPSKKAFFLVPIRCTILWYLTRFHNSWTICISDKVPYQVERSWCFLEKRYRIVLYYGTMLSAPPTWIWKFNSILSRSTTTKTLGEKSSFTSFCGDHGCAVIFVLFALSPRRIAESFPLYIVLIRILPVVLVNLTPKKSLSCWRMIFVQEAVL